MQPITIRALPKVNLTLRILGRRPDGYHELESLVAFAQDVADTVTLTPASTRRVTTTGPFGSSLAGENLIGVTLDLIARTAPDLTLGDVLLDKHLPIAAGIGGGSADAAALITAIRRANPLASRNVDWSALATRIGADVPVCLQSTAQTMRGIGERLTLTPIAPLCAVLANPQVPVPADKTAQVFRKLSAPPLAAATAAVASAAVSSRADVLAHMRTTGNDLLPAARAVVPIIDDVLSALVTSHKCDLAQLSGGGPTCFGIFPDMASAHAAASALMQTHPSWWIRASSLS